MPTYVYKNMETGEVFELKQSIRDDALTKHPETGAPIQRMVQPVGIAFKGSGFYVNDSRQTSSTTPSSTSKGKREGGSSEGSSSQGAQEGAKADSSNASSSATSSAADTPKNSTNTSSSS